MNSRLIAIGVLIVSLCVFGCEVKKLARLEEEANGLVAEYNARTSWGSLGSSFIRAVFDGATLGTFSENGIFTESKKLENLDADFARRGAEIGASYSSAVTIRRWALYFAMGSVIALFLIQARAPSPPTPVSTPSKPSEINSPED